MSNTVRPLAIILPAYNEAGRIQQVLRVVQEVKGCGDIIVVDDGSTDNTAEVVAREIAGNPRMRLIRHPYNKGKGEAIFTGGQATSAPFLMTIDTDLQGVTVKHLNALITPVLSGRADMTLGLFRGGHWNTDLSHRITPWLTGQRCFRASLLRHVSPQAAGGYGIEVALTVAAAQLEYRCLRVDWVGVSHPPSETHRGLLTGLANRLKMYVQIIRSLSFALNHRQMKSILRLWTSLR